jgi:MFS family permease
MTDSLKDPLGPRSLPRKWLTLVLVSLAELMAMAVWFSASAVVPTLTGLWSLGDSGRAWLTMSVQGGFVVGALASSLINLPDRVVAQRLFATGALLAAGSTAGIALLARGLAVALPLRFTTGLALAGVYPVGMKIMATWTKRDRGLAIGLLVGALTLGSAAPHLLGALRRIGDWRPVLYLSGLLGAAGGALALLGVREGPYRAASPRFDWRYAGRVVSDRPVLMANLGYLGHMWELFAVWAWVPLFVLASFRESGVSPRWAGIAAFAFIAAGAPGSVAAGLLADRLGRTRVIMASLAASGVCSLVVGHLFGRSPLLLGGLLLVWGFAVVADSAQYSASVTELCDPRYTGTALTLQTCLGFLLTMATIRLVPTLVSWLGWGWAFSFLAVGPAVGLAATAILRRSGAAERLAGGRR